MAVDQQAESPSGPWSSRNGLHGKYNGMTFNMIFCLFFAFSVSIQNDNFTHIYHCTFVHIYSPPSSPLVLFPSLLLVSFMFTFCKTNMTTS